MHRSGKDAPCSVCGSIPDRSGAFFVGGECRQNSIPEDLSRLEIVGHPYFKESTSQFNSHLKRCPECGAVFRWTFSYEYLVGGSEDEVDLVRLDPEEAERAVAEALATVREAQEQFETDAAALLDALVSPTGDERTRAANDLWFAGAVRGLDCLFALPILAEALTSHPHEGESCLTCLYLGMLFDDVAQRSAEHRRLLRAELEPRLAAEIAPEIAARIRRLLGFESV